MFTVTKTYRDLPAAHRQPGHEGHCRLIHGHNWGFDITFACSVLDRNEFVVDLGELELIKKFLVTHFDHTLLLNATDYILEDPGSCLLEVLAKCIKVPNCGMEGLAKFVFDEVQNRIHNLGDGFARGLKVIEVTCWEDSKNRATYRP